MEFPSKVASRPFNHTNGIIPILQAIPKSLFDMMTNNTILHDTKAAKPAEVQTKMASQNQFPVKQNTFSHAYKST
jgi:hypothetical protein